MLTLRLAEQSSNIKSFSAQSSPKSAKTVRFTDTNLFREIFNMSTSVSSTNLHLVNSNDEEEMENVEKTVNGNTG